MDIVKVYTARDNFEANMLTSILLDEDIPCYSKESGVGEWMKITQGFSVFGSEIYVAEEDGSSAKLLIAQAIRDSVLEVKPEDEIDMSTVPWYKNRTKLVRVCLFVAIPLAIIIALYGSIV